MTDWDEFCYFWYTLGLFRMAWDMWETIEVDSDGCVKFCTGIYLPEFSS